MPVTTPDAAPTVAVAVLLLVQVPPDGLLDTVVVLPMHKVESPVIADGALLTVTIAVREHPTVFV